MKVSIIQRILPEYRTKLFELMDAELKSEDISFRLYYGKELEDTTPVTVPIKRSWARFYKNYYLSFFGKTLVIQKVPVFKLLKSNLIIIEQANNLLLNYLLLALKPLFKYKIAYWGHGYNKQAANKNSFSERLKSRLLKKVDWWFAYTQGTANFLLTQGYPNTQTTVLRNTIDTARFQDDLSSVTDNEIAEFIQHHKLSLGKTAVYCGGFTPLKEIGFLLKSALEIKKILPDFTLILVGNGPEEDLVCRYCEQYPWIQYHGKCYGKEKAVIFKSSDCLLMPGMVGLVAIDAIIAEIPIIIRDLDTHSPEIEYITEYKTGISTQKDMGSYVNGVLEVLSNHDHRQAIVDRCRNCSHGFRIETMASTYVSGIANCLTGPTDKLTLTAKL